MNRFLSSAHVLRASLPLLAARSVAAVALWLGAGLTLVAQEASPAGIEVQELRAALDASQKQVRTAEWRIAALEETKRALAESLAEANREAEAQAEAHRDLLIKMESLGVDVLSRDPRSLEQRLLKAVRDRDLERRETERLRQRLLALTESIMSYLGETSEVPGKSDAQDEKKRARDLLEEELRATETVLVRGHAGLEGTAPKALAEGRVVSLEDSIGLLVLDVGKDSGLRVGMPLQVLRSQRPIGTALVVDVRDRIAGAVLEELVDASDDVKVGDRIAPRTGDI